MTYEGKTISFQTFIVDSVWMDLFGIKIKKDIHVASDVKLLLDTRAINEMGLTENSLDYTYYDQKEQIAGIVEDFHIRTILDDQHPLRILIAKPSEQYAPWSVLIKVRGDENGVLPLHRQIPKLSEQFGMRSKSQDAYLIVSLVNPNQ